MTEWSYLAGMPVSILATESSLRARECVEAMNAEVHAVWTTKDLVSTRAQWRAAVRAADARTLIVHSRDWARRPTPQLVDIAMAAAPVTTVLVLDEKSGSLRRVSKPRALATGASVPLQVVGGLAAAAAEIARFGVGRGAASRKVRPGRPESRALLAIWRGDTQEVGGSVSHISGILSGFRQLGWSVGLVAAAPPPDQVAAAVDTIECAPPTRSFGRLTTDVEAIVMNVGLRRAIARLSARLRPDFIYQRHGAFLTAGADYALAARLPLVLEWNSSATWVRQHWENMVPVERIFDPSIRAMQAYCLRAAAAIAAVSAHALDVAVAEGAEVARTFVSPNGVDTDTVAAAAVEPYSDRVRLGWIGSFGPWHGAPIAVEALAHLPENVELLMIGDGAERHSCERLAAELGVAGRINWTGAMPRHDALDLLRTCNVLVSPHVPLNGTPFFGSPTKIFEYMALGRPIVASALGQIGEILKDGETAILVEPGDVRGFADGVRRALSLPAGGAALGGAARRDVEMLHTWRQRAASMLEHLY